MESRPALLLDILKSRVPLYISSGLCMNLNLCFGAMTFPETTGINNGQKQWAETNNGQKQRAETMGSNTNQERAL